MEFQLHSSVCVYPDTPAASVEKRLPFISSGILIEDDERSVVEYLPSMPKTVHVTQKRQ